MQKKKVPLSTLLLYLLETNRNLLFASKLTDGHFLQVNFTIDGDFSISHLKVSSTWTYGPLCPDAFYLLRYFVLPLWPLAGISPRPL